LTIVFDILSILCTSALLAAAFPPHGYHFLAWVALVPLFLRLRGAGVPRGTLLSFAAGFLYYTGLLWWLLRAEGLNPRNYAAMQLVHAWYFGVFGAAASFLRKRFPSLDPLAFPTVWVLLEYAKAHIGFLSEPWGTLAYSQYLVPPVGKVSAYAGVYGVSFLIVAANASLSVFLSPGGCDPGSAAVAGRGFHPSRKTAAAVLAGIVVSLAASGISDRLARADSGRMPTLKVAFVQGNLYEDDTKKPDYSEKVFGKYIALTKQATDSRPDMIVWPSSSVPGRIPYDRWLVARLAEVAKSSGAFFLVGSAGFDKFNEAQRKEQRIANSAFLFSPGGEILGRYDKMRLLPFDEYVPFRGYFRWPSWIVATDIKDHYPGKESTVFRTDRARFGVLICWENYFPDQFRELAGKGVDFMVGMTNEGFTRNPGAHSQMLAFYVFRAIENHVAIARTASTGVSGVIGTDGRFVAKVQSADGKDTDIEGEVTADLPLTAERTFYNRFGDVFVAVLLVLLAGMLLRMIIPSWARRDKYQIRHPIGGMP